MIQRLATPMLALALITPIARAEFEETTNTKVNDGEDDLKGGYTKDELRNMQKEQKAIVDKFMKGRYSSATGKGSRYSNILEYHDSNFDGLTEHEGANNAAEGSGDLVGLGKKGLKQSERLKKMVTERVSSSGNCELTKEDQEYLKKDQYSLVTGAVKGKAWDEKQLLNEVMGSSWTNLLEIDPNTKKAVAKKFQVNPSNPNDPNVDRNLEADKALELFRRESQKQGYVTKTNDKGEATDQYYMKCPNVSAIVLDKGAAHGADIGAGHRVYALNEKTFKAASGNDGPYGKGVDGEAKKVAEEYSKAVSSDSGTTAIPPEVVAAMRAQGMNISASADGKSVTITSPDGTETRTVAGSIDDLRSEFAWLETQKKHRLNETWKTLRAERFLQGDSYDPAAVSNEIGSLLAKHANAPEAERDKIVAEKVAEHNVYKGTEIYLKVSGAGTNILLGQPGTAPTGNFSLANKGALIGGQKIEDICGSAAQVANCYLAATATDLRSPKLAQLVGMNPNDLTQVALDAAKREAQSNPTKAADLQKNKSRLTQRVQECMSRGKWCEQVDLSAYSSLASDAAKLQKALDSDPKLKGRGITVDDVKAGTAYLETQGDPGNAFKDTREFIAAQMETAMEGPLSQFLKTVESADFSANTDAKTGTNNFAVVKKQWEQNMRMTEETLAFSKKAYQDCVASRGKNCEEQFNSSNYDPTSMNTLQLFGRDVARDGSTTGLEKTVVVPEAGGGQYLKSPSSAGAQPRSQVIPERGSAPASAASPFSFN
ncbi:MAG TPA: hypothetical protein VM901_04125 [Bdellovibrionota bacterium]|nr:hypothetical protein [Bdellovibrionota bacterium]